MSTGVADADNTKLRGVNPYWRLAYNREWGAHSLMVGTSGMVSRVYDDPLDTSDRGTTHRFRDLGLDAQYQYLLDPHAVTAQLAFMSNQVRYSTNGIGAPPPGTNLSDTNRVLRGKLTYVYQARYGGSVGVFNLSGTSNPAYVTYVTGGEGPMPSAGQPAGNRTGSPATRGFTLEAFWTPIQYLRVGAQFTGYNRFNGAAGNYDGYGRNASDNNSMFLYTWLAY